MTAQPTTPDAPSVPERAAEPDRPQLLVPEATEAAEATEAPGGDRNLVLDELDERLERFRVLRKTDSAEADRLLDDLGATTNVDRQIVLELSSTRPLAYPDRFLEAHAMAMRSLEVLDRNGGRGVSITGIGPLALLAKPVVQIVTRFIVRSHQARVVDAIRNLYARREASCAWADPARPMLSRARMHAERVSQGYKRNPLAFPSLLIVIGGALVSSLGRAVIDLISPTRSFALVATASAFVLFGVAAWVILRGAAVARRRIRLTTEGPVAALWETIGRCGNPPKDESAAFALYAIILTAVGWLLIPIGVGLAFAFD